MKPVSARRLRRRLAPSATTLTTLKIVEVSFALTEKITLILEESIPRILAR